MKRLTNRTAALWAVIAIIVLPSLTAFAQGRRPITFDDLMAVKRIAYAQVSPDGKQVVFVVTNVDKAANRSQRGIWIVPTAGGEPRALITSERNDDTPRWSKDGKWLAFISSRGGAP